MLKNLLSRFKSLDRRMQIAVVIAIVVFCCIIPYIVGPLTPSSEEEESPTQIPDSTTSTIVEPTDTPIPGPTNTPEPTNTLEPTNTPEPTATPTEVPSPTPLPEPIALTGSGDSVIDFDNPFDISIAHITGNAASRHFAVKNFDEGGGDIDLLVNTTDPYDGVVLLDPGLTHTTRFEITAAGEWTILVSHLLFSEELVVPGAIEGNGDNVVILFGEAPDLATIIGNAESRHFAIKTYGINSSDLIVNTTDPYEGTVILYDDTKVFEITASGPWSIEVTAK